MSVNAPNILPPKNYNSFSEFKELTRPHKALVVILSIFIVLFSAGACTPLIPELIGRIRRLELKDAKPVIQKVNKAAEALKNAENKAGDINPQESALNLDDFSPEELEALFADAEQLERENLIAAFWLDYNIVDKIIDDFQEANKQKNPVPKVETDPVLEKYCEFKKNEGQVEFRIEEKSLLFEQIKNILIDKNDPIKFPSKILRAVINPATNKEEDKFVENEEVITKKTIGDGSCAIHALLGEEVDGFYRCNALEARKKFCDYLQKAFDEKKHPEIIENILANCFDVRVSTQKNLLEGEDLIKKLREDDPEGEDLRKALTVTIGRGKAKRTVNLLEQFTQGYNELPDDQKEKKKQAFKYNPLVFKAYKNYLAQNKTYLTQDEFMAVAQFFNIRVRFFQGGWFNDAKNLREAYMIDGKFYQARELTTEERNKPYIPIYYRAARRHFERAEVHAPQVPQGNVPA